MRILEKGTSLLHLLTELLLFQYVAFVLASIICQGGIQYKLRQEYKEQARREAKEWTLPTFSSREKSVTEDIQRIQQENGCCG